MHCPEKENFNWCTIIIFFSLIVYGGTEVPIIVHFPLPPLRGQPTVKCHPRWQLISGLAVHCRLGRLLDSNPGLQFYNLVSLPMSHYCSLSHHCSRWATTAPYEPPLLPCKRFFLRGRNYKLLRIFNSIFCIIFFTAKRRLVMKILQWSVYPLNLPLISGLWDACRYIL